MKITNKIKGITRFFMMLLLGMDILLVYWIHRNDFVVTLPVLVTLILIPVICMFCLIILYRQNIKMLFHKIDERERSVDDLLKLVEDKCDEARAIARNKSDFLSNMSHEIRTPINAVLGMNEMILRECDDNLVLSYAYNVKNSGNMLLSLVNDILDFSKIESGKMEIVYGNYQLMEMINELVNMTNSRIRDKDLKLELEISPNLPRTVFGDDIRIKQILVNLLTNAVKYTPEGKIILRISGEQRDNFYVFRYEVEDSGIGIKEEDLKKLTEKFTRFDQKKNKNVEGTGLGLHITNRLLELMGSKLQVQSVYGKGSVFYFDLEQKIIDFSPMGEFHYMLHDQHSGEKYEIRFIAPEASILVVDDNEMNRTVFKALVKGMQLQIDEADSGKTCLEKIHEKKYDLIFMDHMMPEMDGIETYQKMKESTHHYNLETPVIILTANAIAGAKETYLKEGFQEYLSKPIVPEKLEDMLLRFLPDELVKKDGFKKVQNKVRMEEQIPIEGLDWNYAAIHFSDQDTLIEAIRSFYRALGAEADKLQNLWEKLRTVKGEDSEIDDLARDDLVQEALNAYRVQVHAMKSAANIIALVPLSGSAALLEYAARDGRIEQIIDTTPYFLNDWNGYKAKLRPMIQEGEKNKIEKIEEVIDAFSQLSSAVESMDINLSDHIMAYLREFQFEQELEKSFEELEAAVTNLEDETVSKLVTMFIERLGEKSK